MVNLRVINNSLVVDVVLSISSSFIGVIIFGLIVSISIVLSNVSVDVIVEVMVRALGFVFLGILLVL